MEQLAKSLQFYAIYATSKCEKTMICGSVILLFIFLVHGRRSKTPVWLRYYSIFFLFPMVFMSMSKLFFVRPFVWITAWSSVLLKPLYAQIYMTVMLLLLFVFFIRHAWLRRRIQRLPLLARKELAWQAIDRVTAGAGNRWRKKYLQSVRIYVTDRCESPFSGGIVRPYIVLPSKLLDEWGQDKCLTVLCHELIHIGMGHIVMLTLFELLKIYWWINPLVYICEHMLREDIEFLCDEACVFTAGVSKIEYGTILLEMITMFSGVCRSETAAFAEKNTFVVLKRRICHLGQTPGRRQAGRQRRSRLCLAGALAVLLFAIMATSYPRYTVMAEIALFNEELELVDYDSPRLREAVEHRDGELVLDEGRFAQLLREEQIDGEYVYVTYDTIMKVPGVGGGGNVGMIAVDDLSDIFYLRADTWENDALEFILKYLI